MRLLRRTSRAPLDLAIVVLEFLGLITLAVSASASCSIPTGTAGPHFHFLGRGRYQGEKRSGGGDMSIEPGWV